jgi:adenosylhomocysteine nucleosidase
MAVIAVTGLRAEAAIARRAGLTVVCAGGVSERTRIALDRALDGGADAIISFGLAGGLAPQLRPGALIVASEVLDPDGKSLAVDEGRAATIRQMVGALDGAVLGALTPAGSAAAKAALFAQTGALAVDLESLAVARAAQSRGLPCVVLRAIADPATRDLPPAALIALRQDGTADLSRILWSVAQHPGQIADLIRLALDAGRALQALRRAVAAARPALLRSRH